MTRLAQLVYTWTSLSEIVTTRRGKVVDIEIARPAKKNALTAAMYESLIEGLRGADADPDVRVVTLFGRGGDFTAGNDIGDFLASAATIDPLTSPPARFIETVATLSKPLVAAVDGRAVGVGATILLHCDLVYATESARLSMPFVSLGLVPEAASSLLLPARVGHAIASEMLLLGTALDARRAAALGLVNDVVATTEELVALVRARADELAAKPPRSVRTTKALLKGDSAAMLARMREEAHLFAEAMRAPEATEAFTAFLERRAPDFSRF